MSFVTRLISLSCLVLSLLSSAAGAQECDHRVIFLPQTHPADEMTGVEMSESQNNLVAASQLKIARYIEQSPGIAVFSEQMSAKDLSLDLVPPDRAAALRALFDEIFPDGLPDNPYLLSDAQRKKLIDNGGDSVQLIRGKVDVLHRVVENKDDLDAIFNPIKNWFAANPGSGNYPAEIGSLVYGARERAALGQIQSYFSQNPDEQDAILIFGANHSFTFYPEQFPPECVVVPAEFQADWLGRRRSGPEGF